MGKDRYGRTKLACYMSSGSMAVVATLSPLLFGTFRTLYGVSYTQLGFLVVVNFFTQMVIDLVFTFFTKYFNIHKTVRLTPVFTFFGLLLYGIMPLLFPEHAFLYLALGTVIFSMAAGLNEVLLSPVIAAIPSDRPEREMSKLHSMYAWGVVVVVLISTLLLKGFGAERWYILPCFWALVPFIAFFLFRTSPLPDMEMDAEGEKSSSSMGKGVLLCAACIFFGGATECTMSQWVPEFLESAMEIPKVIGDILGVATFATLLGLGRTLYAKYGSRILRVMFIGMTGALVCYIGAGISLHPVLGLMFCVITGICSAMLWPGTLICLGENFPGAGVAAYALMAAGGDLGASFGSQMVGVLADRVGAMEWASRLAETFSMTTEQVGMRAGLLVSGLFPLCGMIILILLTRYLKTRKAENKGE